MYPIRDGPWVTSVQNEFNYHEGEVRFENWYQPNEVGLKPHFFNRGIDLEDIAHLRAYSIALVVPVTTLLYL